MRSAKMMFLPFILIACETEKDDFAPKEGVWGMSDPSVDDECGVFGDEDPSGEEESVTLTMDGDGAGFTIETDDEDDSGGASSPITCELDGKDFTCDTDDGPGDDTWDLTEEGVDAIIYMTWGIGGTFTSKTAGTMYSELSMTCEGTECDVATDGMGISFPCTSRISFSITAE